MPLIAMYKPKRGRPVDLPLFFSLIEKRNSYGIQQTKR